MLVCPYYPPHIGGVENYVYHIAKGLSQTHDWEVIVITSNRQDKRLQTTLEGSITVYRLPIMFTFSNTPINPAWYFQIKKIIAVEKPQLINAHAPVPFVAEVAGLACGKIPYILTYHSDSMIKHVLFTDIPILLYERFVLPNTLRKSQFVICTSDFIKSWLSNIFRKKAVTITPGVDIPPAKSMQKKRAKTVLFVAELKKATRYKGLKYLLRAISLIKNTLPSVSLVVVGGGNALKEYELLARKLKITGLVDFKGSLRGKKLWNAYRQASVFVLPSLKESFGTVLIEAMAHNLPVIGTHIGGIPDIVTHGKEGLIVPPYNSQALADAITTILKNSALAETMGKAGFEKVKNNYLWDTKLKTTKAVFERFL